MKLIAMRLSGIGPYKDSFAIDFATLSRNHMFLIDGETGSGKTTILDCITFALYGSISGNTSDTVYAGARQRLRSRFLEGTDKPSEVELIFETNGKIYHLRRSPDYSVPKKRGEGMRNVKARAMLCRVASASMPNFHELLDSHLREEQPDPNDYFTFMEQADAVCEHDTQVREVNMHVEELLGLNRKHFEKTVMLAQGRFAEFLGLKPEERTKIIMELFDAKEYEDIQNELDTMRRDKARALDLQANTLYLSISDAYRNAQRLLGQLAPFLPEEPTEDPAQQEDSANPVDADSADGNNLDLDSLIANAGDEFSQGSEQDDAAAAEVVQADLFEHLDDLKNSMEEGSTDSSGNADEADASVEPAEQPAPSTRAQIKNPHSWCLGARGDLEESRLRVDNLSSQLPQMAQMVQEKSRELLEFQEEIVSETREERARAFAHVQAVRECAKLVEELQGAVTLKKSLENRGQAIATGRHWLERYALATPIVAKHTEVKACAMRVHAISVELEKLEQRLSACASQQELRNDYGTAMAAAAARETAERQREIVDSHERQLAHHAELKTREEELEQVTLADRGKLETVRGELSKMPQREHIAMRLQELATLLGREEQLREQLATAEQEAKEWHRYHELEERCETLHARQNVAQAALAAAVDVLERARHAREMSGAVQYAQSLEEGKPCPVCGSTEHPHPAVSEGEVPDEKRIKSYAEAVEEHRRSLDRENAQLTTAQALYSNMSDKYASLSEEEMEQSIVEARAEVSQIRQWNEERAALQDQDREVRELEERLQALQQQSVEHETQWQDAVLQVKLDATRLEQAGVNAERVSQEREEVRQRLDEASAAQDRAEQLKRQMEEVEALTEQRTQLRSRCEAGEQDLAKLNEQFGAMLKDSAFKDASEAKAAMLEDSDVKNIKDAIVKYEREKIENQGALDSLAGKFGSLLDEGHVKELGLAEKDVAAVGTLGEARSDELNALASSLMGAMRQETAEETAAAAAQELEQALRAVQSAQDLTGHCDRSCESMLEASRQWCDAMRDFEPLQDMALLAKGEGESVTGQRLSLATYAVTERFRDVLVRANELLRDIHGGVYELRLGEHEGSSRNKTGLPIQIFDRRTELLAEPSTLSGGETFFVSLALALALADVIEAQNGGVRMETLFIDEGFGSLSDEYLDDVMEVLRSVAKRRDIGIISHVGQLKDQVSQRITVSRASQNAASTLEVVM